MFVAIVPAYNEEKSIASVISDLLTEVDSVVVVDDASLDATVALAKAAGAVVLQHEINRGQGAALETGHAYARTLGAEYVIHFDADGQFDVADIAPALHELKQKKADILFGSRFLGKNSNVPWTKKNIIFPLGKIINTLFGSVALSDVHNGFRILSSRALEKVVITQERMAHATEIPALVKFHNLSYVEFPITVTYHEYGQSGIGGLHVVKDLITGKFLK